MAAGVKSPGFAGQVEVKLSATRRITLTPTPTREERFTALYDDHLEAVRRYVWRRDASLCDDVVAETFLVAWRRLEHVPHDARPWLIGVARNVRLNLLRSARRQHAVSNRLIETASRPEQPGTSHETDAVKAALSMLPEADREVLLLSVWDDLDRGAIAQVLGCSKPNVSVRLHRARRRLRATLAEVSGESVGVTRPSPILGGASDVR
jgi:RNA polymerase sigma-70 factor (ECF subfamily)